MLLDLIALAPEGAGLSAEEFRTELERLKSKGYLEEEDGTLKLGLDVGAVEEYETDGFASPSVRSDTRISTVSST